MIAAIVCRENGKMETAIVYRENGKEHGNYVLWAKKETTIVY